MASARSLDFICHIRDVVILNGTFRRSSKSSSFSSEGSISFKYDNKI